MDSNKIDLAAFLAKEWQRSDYAPRLHGRSFFVTHGTNCTRLSSSDGVSVTSMDVQALTCTHEEADTRLLLHAAHAVQNGSAAVVIRSPDTDVAILAIVLQPEIGAPLFFRTGTKARSRFIDIQAVRAKRCSAVCNALLGLHALTGCDSCSAFKRKGKKSALDLLYSSPVLCAGLQRLGQGFQVSEELHALCEKFVCLLYGSKTFTDVNLLRYDMFATKATESEYLPPTKDALRQHVIRSNYQAGIWLRSLQSKPQLPGADENGWYETGDGLAVQWMMQRPAPDELLVLSQCHCKRGCASGRCSCVRAGLPCTDACSCGEVCQNQSRGFCDADEEEV